LINNLPLFDEDKSLVACVDLFEYKPIPAKQKLYKHKAYIVAGYEGTQTNFVHNQNSRKTSKKNAKYSECSSNNVAELTTSNQSL